MEKFLYDFSVVLGTLLSFVPLIYCPFAKTWFRAMMVIFILGFTWAVVRFMSCYFFREWSPPGVFFVIVPLECMVVGAIARGLKLLICRWPPFGNREDCIRQKVNLK